MGFFYFNPSIYITINQLCWDNLIPHKRCIESFMFDKYEYHKYFSSVSVGLY